MQRTCSSSESTDLEWKEVQGYFNRREAKSGNTAPEELPKRRFNFLCLRRTRGRVTRIVDFSFGNVILEHKLTCDWHISTVELEQLYSNLIPAKLLVHSISAGLDCPKRI